MAAAPGLADLLEEVRPLALEVALAGITAVFSAWRFRLTAKPARLGRTRGGP